MSWECVFVGGLDLHTGLGGQPSQWSMMSVCFALNDRHWVGRVYLLGAWVQDHIFTCGSWSSRRSGKSVCILLGSQPQRIWTWFPSYRIFCLYFRVSVFSLSYLYSIFKMFVTVQILTDYNHNNTKTSPQAKRHQPSLLITSLVISTSLTFTTR